jgi:putative membrane protein
MHLAHAAALPLEEAFGATLVLAGLAVAAGATGPPRGRRGRHRRWCLAAGAVVGGAALLPPLASLAGSSLTGHMVQHLLLTLVAAPLLVLGEPTIVVARRMTDSARRRMTRCNRMLNRWTRMPRFQVAAVVVFLTAMTVWHVPVAYDAATADDFIHALEHITMLGTAVMFWSAVLAPRPAAEPPLVPVAMLLAVTVHGALLGLAMSFSPGLWYAPLGGLEGTEALLDQQASGAIMWGVGGLVTIVAAVGTFGAWLHRSGLEDERGRALAFTQGGLTR